MELEIRQFASAFSISSQALAASDHHLPAASASVRIRSQLGFTRCRAYLVTSHKRFTRRERRTTIP